jgi:hypothetical protein
LTPSRRGAGRNEEALVAVATVDRSTGVVFWQYVLAISGALLILASVVLELVILNYHSTSTVTKLTGGATITTTGPSAPPASLVATVFATGIIALLAAAFFSRISKVVLTGVGEIDLQTQADIAAASAGAAKNDPTKIKAIYQLAAPRVAESLRSPTASGIGAIHLDPMRIPAQAAANTPSNLVGSIVQEAARELNV